MEKILAVGIGGFLGSIMRYLISVWTVSSIGVWFPFATLIVNVLGCFLIGFLAALSLKIPQFSDLLKTILITGFLGAFTTFSTFGLETINHIDSGEYHYAAFNILLNLVFGILAVTIGAYLTSFLDFKF